MLLTGESLPVQKDAEITLKNDTGPGDRLNIAFSSSTVTKGRATGIVFATGMATEIGSIALASHASDSKTRRIKRKPDGSAKPHRYAEAWALTAADFIGHFLGVNVGTPLQRKLSKLALLLFGTVVICAIIVLGANGFSNNPEVVIYAVATGLSMIPASLVVVLTVTMAAGTKRMVQRHVIVRKLDSLEALGAVTSKSSNFELPIPPLTGRLDICSDKTGTLTQGRMVVKKAWIPAKGTYSVGNSNDSFNLTVGDLTHTPQQPIKIKIEDNERAIRYKELLKDNPLLEKYLNAASLANLAHVHKSDRDSGSWMARGDPTEIAIQVFASRFDWNKERLTKGDNPLWTQIAEFPFDSDIKKMSVIFQKSGGDGVSMSVFTKGAVERVLGSCTHITWDERMLSTEMNDEFRDIIIQNVDELASQGLRVLALASKDCSSLAGPVEGYRRAEAEKDLTFQGLIGLYDPPRPESASAVQECHLAEISVHMVTGDHIGTARAIAAQIGILPSNMNTLSRNVADSMVMTATQFDRLSDTEVDRLSVLPFVIARCSPHTKVRMIEALHRRKCFAAVTGDGVNDSPSLKKSDVGIAMRRSGSDVAKGASDIVLTDDNFASILNAVEEGRRMFDNIQKFVLHLLAENIALACVLLIGLIFKDQAGTSVFPVTPVEIL